MAEGNSARAEDLNDSRQPHLVHQTVPGTLPYNKFIKFTGDTTVGRISGGDGVVCRQISWHFVKDWSLYPPPKRTSTATAVSGGHTASRDTAHPRHRAFELLPSGRQFTMLRAQTNRPRGSFYNRATALINAKRWQNHVSAIYMCRVTFFTRAIILNIRNICVTKHLRYTNGVQIHF